MLSVTAMSMLARIAVRSTMRLSERARLARQATSASVYEALTSADSDRKILHAECLDGGPS